MKHLKSDLVVIGAGGAGMSAALRAQQLGGLDVIMIEKRPYVGGNTGMAGGDFQAVGTKLQKAAGIEVDPEDVIQEALNYHKYDRINIPLYRKLIKTSASALEWLISIGADYSYTPEGGHTPTHRNLAFGTFNTYTKMMARLIRENGGAIYTSSEAQAILLDSEGKVCGVNAVIEGVETLIETASVAVTTGGFMGNDELMFKYFPEYYDTCFTTDGIKFNGEGISLVKNAGGQLAKSCTLNFHGGYSFDRRNAYPNKIATEANLWVNQSGRRYVAEKGKSREDARFRGNAINNQPGKIGYAIFDQKAMNDLIHASEMSIFFDNTLDIIPQALEYESKTRKWVCISDDLEEIGCWIGAKPEVFVETVEKYNRACAAGFDEEFGKDPSVLIPVDQPPYIALKYVPLMIETYGPVVTDANMNVVDDASEPIPGLYSAGVIVSGWQGRDYYLRGSSMGFSITGGYIAGASIADYISNL